jgi:predicted Zn-dependent protease
VPKPQQALFGKQTWKYASGAKYVLKNAHPQGTEVVDLKFLRNGHSLLSRGADETCKLWDVRALKEAVHEWTLPLPHSHSRLCISPQEDMLLAGMCQLDLKLF